MSRDEGHGAAVPIPPGLPVELVAATTVDMTAPRLAYNHEVAIRAASEVCTLVLQQPISRLERITREAGLKRSHVKTTVVARTIVARTLYSPFGVRERGEVHVALLSVG